MHFPADSIADKIVVIPSENTCPFGARTGRIDYTKTIRFRCLM